MKEHSGCIVEMKEVQKIFPGVVAVDRVNLSLRTGEVHALMGENGAGKSTIMKMLTGILPIDGGKILYNGQPFVPKEPVQALRKGISMIPQELDLVPQLTVWENIYAGAEKVNKLGLLNKKEMIADTSKFLQELDVSISPEVRVRELSVAKMQMVAIVKAIAFDAKVIIMDEPTSAITDREVEQLFQVIEKLKRQGKAIVYISHKMDEIFRIADVITIMRDGKHIITKEAMHMSKDEVIRLMVGRELSNLYPKNRGENETFDNDEVLLEIDSLTRKQEFQDISFQVKRGEILGISGLMGAGRTEVMETIFGLRKPDFGTISIKGRTVNIKNPQTAIRHGLAFVSEDRKLYGLNLTGTIKTNTTIAYLKQVLIGGFLLNFKKERLIVDKLMKQLTIKAHSREMTVNNLSGGNQQKVIVAKWLMGDPDIFIMDEPTRGIDVGAKAEIYKIMEELISRGKSIIMISSEMPELLGMSDRIIVMHEGRITGRFTQEECSQEKLMACSVGGDKDEN